MQASSDKSAPASESAKKNERKKRKNLRRLCNFKETVNVENAFRYRIHYYGETRDAQICGVVCLNFRELD